MLSNKQDKQEPRSEQAPEPQTAAVEKRKEVRVVVRQNDLYLVEWLEDGAPRRSWLPASDVTQQKDGTTQAANPGHGVPYGDDFLHGVKLQATTEAVERELRQRGIWTADDALSNAPAVLGALQAVYGVDVAALMQAAVTYKREQRK